MANIKPTKKDVTALAAVLEGEYATAEEAALAALNAAFDLYESKSKFLIVGHMRYAPGAGFLKPEDPRALRVALGPYPSLATANNAQASLLYSNATGEEFRRWVLPMHTQTPAAWFRERKKARELASMEAKKPRGMTAEEEARAPKGIGLDTNDNERRAA